MHFTNKVKFTLLISLKLLLTSALEGYQHQPIPPAKLLQPALVHQFPAGTWIENLAVRSNGEILVTELTRPRIYLLDPLRATEDPLLVHEFNDTAGVLGIVEVETDVFYVCTANYSSTTLESYGEAFVYRLDMRTFSRHGPSPTAVTKLATVAGGAALDGLTYFAALDEGVLFASDLLRGVIWRIGVSSGDVSLAANNSYTRSAGFQVNGLKVQGDELFFAVTEAELWAKVSLTAHGNIGEDYTVLAQGGFKPDDFALDLNGNGYIASLASGSNGVVYIHQTGGDPKLITNVRGPSACAFGRTAHDCHILYITTTGGDEDYTANGTFVGAGTLSKVDLGPRAALECRRYLAQQSTSGWIRGLSL